jgi:uncharacterized protein
MDLIEETLPEFRVNIGIQSNGLLIDSEYLELFESRNISIGISLDGLPKDNDQFRYYHNGKGSGEDVSSKLKLIKVSCVEKASLGLLKFPKLLSYCQM